MPTTTRCCASWRYAASAPIFQAKPACSPARTCAGSYQIYTDRCLPAGARCRFEPSTAGLQPCCATRRSRWCSAWGCLSTTSCWKTTHRPGRWCGDAFTRPWWPTYRCAPTSMRWCRRTVASRPARPCRRRSTSGWSLRWPMNMAWWTHRYKPSPSSSLNGPGLLRLKTD